MACTDSCVSFDVGFLHVRQFDWHDAHCGRPHKHQRDHVTMCIRGNATVTLDGIATVLHEGKAIHVPANALHGITTTEDALIHCIFLREDDPTAYDGID